MCIEAGGAVGELKSNNCRCSDEWAIFESFGGVEEDNGVEENLRRYGGNEGT